MSQNAARKLLTFIQSLCITVAVVGAVVTMSGRLDNPSPQAPTFQMGKIVEGQTPVDRFNDDVLLDPTQVISK